jgi:MscS family membrane protein
VKAPVSLAMFLFCSVACAFAMAAESVESIRPEAEGAVRAPLQAADTSSPRDTLHGFLSTAGEMYAAGAKREWDDILQLRNRAVRFLDFSETVNGLGWDEQNMRVLYLKEVLDRLALPPWDDIPGADEAEIAGTGSWRIPGTLIEIARIEDGDRQGEFVFSAGTVADLHAIYRQVEDLPYQPGATEGFLDMFRTGLNVGDSLASRIRQRLRPVDDSSPRALLDGFLANANAAYDIVMQADTAMRSQSRSMSISQAREMEAEARSMIDRAVATLDLSRVPVAMRADVGTETVLMLKEIFDRAPLPALQSIPGPRQVERLRDQGESVRWSFPNTDIVIAELTEGPDAGLFRFSAATVERVVADYARVSDLPYRGERDETGGQSRFLEQYQSAEISPDFFQYYITTPGTLIPAASRVSLLIDRLPPVFSTVYLEQTVWQWLGILIALLMLIAALIVVHQIGRWITTNSPVLSASWLLILLPLVSVGVVTLLRDFVDLSMNATGAVLASIITFCEILVTLFLAQAVFRVGVAISETIASLPQMKGHEFDANLIRVAARALGLVAAVAVTVNGFKDLGLDVLPLIAGLGVGGLAVALAVRPTLENMIGGLIIYADKPVKVGDFCTFGDRKGTVESIGLRSTRIRALDRSIITVPNSVFVDMEIVNFARCDTLLIANVIGLRYETSMEQLRNVIAKMRLICFAHPKIETDTLRVRFAGFGSSSLDISVRVYALTNEWNEFYAIQEDLFFRFAEAIEAAGSGVAFPSTTVYLGEDAGLDKDRKRRAEEEVAAWREADELPFPFIPETVANAVIDTLDFPPEGSPGASGKRATPRSAEPVGEDEEEPPASAPRE